ncbi:MULTISPECIES: glycosyl hydrolase family 18 protein [unclassified Microcoleus]|uniref:glycosyl hydrolase family 18 protein n=1 Tax=unclassified Microcoleus TaxID=2642155 RepID=UPI002FD1EACE
MGFSQYYSNVPDWVAKSEGYQTGAMVKYQGNIFYANFGASEPGVGDAAYNGWRFYDELYDQTPHTPTAQAKIIAYIPTWRKKEGFNYANDEMYRYITHGIVSFLMFSEVNLSEFEPKSLDDVKAILSDVVNTGHRNGTRILIALGGAVDYGFLNLMTSIGNNPDNQLLDLAVQNVVNFVKSNNLDGVDLDLECWWGKPGQGDIGGRAKADGPHPAGFALTSFAQKLKQAMPDKLVSAAIFGTSWYGNNYDPKLADYTDWLAIMTYDLTGSWNASPVGPQSALLKIRNQESYLREQQGKWPDPQNQDQGPVNNPILSVEDTLWYWTNPLFVNWQGKGQNIPRDKIAGGVPIYGYDFAYGKDPDDLSGEVPPGYKSIRYKDILAQFPDAHTAANGNIKVSGSTPRPPFISASGNYPYTHNIYFETPDTAVSKLNFLKDVGAQGVIIWELSNDVWEDNKSIIKALYQNSGNPEKPPLPSTLEPSITPLGIFDNAKALTTDSANIIGTSGPPAVAVYDDKLFCVHEGQREDGYLWYCTFDFKRNEWSQDIKLSFGTGGPPAVAVYDNKLFCVHEGQGEDGYLWYCTFDFKRNEWSQDIRLNVGVGSRRHNNPSAALAVYREKLFCVHEGRGEDGLLWGCTFDKNTQTWSEDSKLSSGGKWPWDLKAGTFGSAPPFIKSSGAPGLAVLNDRLICLHEGSSESGTLWHCDFNGTEWSKDQEFFPTAELAAPVISITGPPSLEVIDGKLFCFYEGPGADGSLRTLNYDSKHEDRNTNIGLSGSPAVKAYNGELYILHEGPGEDGRLMMTIAPLPKVQKGWIEVRGENSYCYCVCNRASSEQQGDISHSHTMNIEAGAPYFYAVLTKDDDTVDFPTGAILTIQDPDGTKYDRDIQEENLLVIMSDSSVRCLIVKDPKPGNWTMTMTVPEGVGFHCECNTVPSKDPYKTITTAHRYTNRLQKRDFSDDKWAWVGLAMVATITTGFTLTGTSIGGPLVGAAIGGAVNSTMLAYIAIHSVDNNVHYLKSIAEANSQQSNITAHVVRIATWNVFHGRLAAGVDPYGNDRPTSEVANRVNELVNYGADNNIDIIAFQEIPQSILTDDNHQIFANIRNTPYGCIKVNNEYPPRPNINAPAPASATTDGYLILYNRQRLTLIGNWQYFNPASFLQGLAQSRPPVQLQFGFREVDFNFLTWHTEPQHHFASAGVAQAVNLLTQQQGNWIIAGDLNIYEHELPQGVVNPHHLTHDAQTLDHIITSGTVVNPHEVPVIGPNGIPVNPIIVTDTQWGRFWSDAHYVLFGIAWFE